MAALYFSDAIANHLNKFTNYQATFRLFDIACRIKRRFLFQLRWRAVAFTDFYVRSLATGTFTDPRFF